MPKSATVLASGLHFGEGPRWHEGRLWFSDFYARSVSSISEQGETQVELALDDQPSGLGWTPQGDLLIVSMINRKVLKRTRQGELVAHADLSAVATWHCNDMVVDGRGRAYVGNFGFDLEAAVARDGAGADFANETKARLALIDVDGSVRVVADELNFPNGSVITPDGRTFIVAETFARRLTAFDIADDGGLSNRRTWALLGDRLPDGVCLDAEGAIWIANARSNECVRIAEGGAELERVQTSQPCYACMLGGEDGRNLFMMTAPPLFPDENAPPPQRPGGRIETCRVDIAHAGRP